MFPPHAVLLNEMAYFTVRELKWTELELNDLSCENFKRNSWFLMYCLLFCLFSFCRMWTVIVRSPVYQLRSLLCRGRILPSLGWLALTAAVALLPFWMLCAETVHKPGRGCLLAWKCCDVPSVWTVLMSGTTYGVLPCESRIYWFPLKSRTLLLSFRYLFIE